MGFWQWNLDFLAFLAGLRNPVLDYLIGALTWLGSEYVVIAVLSLIFLCVDKRLGYKLCLVFFSASAIVQTVKLGCRIERPWILNEEYPTEGYSYLDVLGSKAGATGFSFPSGHSVSATSLFGVLASEVTGKRYKALFIGLIAIVAFSRLYLGVHTLFDVTVAVAIALVMLFAVNAVMNRWEDRNFYDYAISGFVAAVSLFAIIFGWINYRDLLKLGEETAKQALDCIKMASCGLGFSIGYLIERKYIHYDPKPGSVGVKALRLLVGVAGVMGLKEGIKYGGKALFGEELLALDVVRYMAMILLVVWWYPLLINAYRKRTAEKQAGKKE